MTARTVLTAERPDPLRRETIFALATPPGRGGIAVVRVSGPEAGTALRSLTRRDLPAPRVLTPAAFRAADGEVLDRGLAAWFPAPSSYTGEDVAEFHLHGGPAVVAGVSQALAGMAGLRLAEAGEFTRRAFENDRMDLTAAEGIADLINAETAAQRAQALRQLDGALGQLYESWRERLVRGLAHIEASLDFADEDLPDGLDATAKTEIDVVAAEITGHLADGHRGERIRDGVWVAIVGPPNAGKSSLLNRLSHREAAIVTPEPGTTRDIVEVALDLGGFPVIVADTAGLRAAAANAIEAEGIRRARRRAEQADIRLVVFDGAVWPAVDRETAAVLRPGDLAVVNKADLGRVGAAPAMGERPLMAVSAVTGAGMDCLVAAVTAEVGARFGLGATPSLTRLRHRTALEACAAALHRASTANAGETMAEELRSAAAALGRITGRVGVEDVLDVVFRDFCIGK